MFTADVEREDLDELRRGGNSRSRNKVVAEQKSNGAGDGGGSSTGGRYFRG